MERRMHLTREQLEHAAKGELDRRVRSHLESCLLCRREFLHVQAMHDTTYHDSYEEGPADSLLGERAEQFGGPSVRYHADRFGMSSMDSSSSGRRGLLILMMIAITFITIVVPLAYYLARPGSETGGVQELVAIHRANLAGGNDFYRQGDAAKLADYFRGHIGFVPVLPPAAAGVSIRGGAVAQFRAQTVATYLVDSPRGPVSIIAVSATPSELGLTAPAGSRSWTGSSVYNHVAAERLGQLTYCAVGPASSSMLAEVLDKVLGNETEQATQPAP